MHKPLLFGLNAFACLLSFALVVLLVLKIPDAIVTHPKDYREALIQRIESERDVAVLKQLCRFKITYLITSNEVCSWLVFPCLVVTCINSAVLVLNCWTKR